MISVEKHTVLLDVILNRMLKHRTTKNAIKQFTKVSQLVLLLLTLTIAVSSQQSQIEDEDYIKPA